MENRWLRINDEVGRLYRLEAQARRIVHRHVRSVPAREMGLEAVLAETRLRCEEYDPEISASVRAWEWGKPLATISAEAQMWRYVRLNSAALWLGMTVEVPGLARVWGEPQATDEEVVRWLLTEWWQQGGILLRALYEMGAG